MYKGKNWQLGQSKLQFFAYRKWHCWGENDSSSHQKIKLWSKSYFCVSDNFKTFSDWAQVQSEEGEVQRPQDSYWHLQRMQSKIIMIWEWIWWIGKKCINLQGPIICTRTHDRNDDDNPAGDWQAQEQREEANGDSGGDRGFRWVFILFNFPWRGFIIIPE